MVVNAPTSNIVSAAEHALALLLATARRIPEADASLRAGKWERSKLSGVEIQGKTVGVIGLGKIGQLFASRIASFGTHVIAYDPYLPQSRATQLGIELVELDELLGRADMMTIHLPKTPETQGLIGKEALAKTKPGVIIINAARGGLVDEDALAEAVRSGHVAGAGVDVYVTEPTTSSAAVRAAPGHGDPAPRRLDRARPRTAPAPTSRTRCSPGCAATSCPTPSTSPAARWARRSGRGWASPRSSASCSPTWSAPRASCTVQVRGELAHEDVSVLSLAALRGVFGEVVDEPVTFVNAPGPGRGARRQRRPSRPRARAPTTAAWSPCARCARTATRSRCRAR